MVLGDHTTRTLSETFRRTLATTGLPPVTPRDLRLVAATLTHEPQNEAAPDPTEVGSGAATSSAHPCSEAEQSLGDLPVLPQREVEFGGLRFGIVVLPARAEGTPLFGEGGHELSCGFVEGALGLLQ